MSNWPHTLFIINPAAGAGRAQAVWAEFERWLGQGRLNGDRLITAGPHEARRLAEDAAPEYERLVAVGGDGTVSEVAGGILLSKASQAALGIVPCGTGNDIAGTLGLDSVAAAQRALKEGRSRLIDVIEVRCVIEGRPGLRYALAFAAVGIASELLKQTTPRVKRSFGWRLAYAMGLVRALRAYHPRRMRVTCDGQGFDERFLLVCAGNGERAGGGMKLSPGALIDDGRLNINLIRAASRWEVLKQLRNLYLGRHTNHPKVRYLTGVNLAVETEAPMEVAADGELIGQTPARFEVRPGGLRLICP